MTQIGKQYRLTKDGKIVKRQSHPPDLCKKIAQREKAKKPRLATRKQAESLERKS